MNTYTKEQKLQHLRLFKASGKNCNEYSREKGIPPSPMHAWVHAFDGLGIAADITANRTPTITLNIGSWSATITGGAGRSDIETLVSVLGAPVFRPFL